MSTTLWHATTPGAAQAIVARGFRRLNRDGDRDTFFSLPGEAYWKSLCGGVLVEVRLSLDEEVLSEFRYEIVYGDRHIPFFSIPPELVNLQTIDRRVIAAADSPQPGEAP